MKNDSKRLFFSLWPTDTVRGQIADAANLGPRVREGRRVAQSNFHMTLAFLHNVPNVTLPCIDTAASQCRFAPFDMSLDHYGYWRRSRMLWLGCDTVPTGLMTLVAELWKSLAACGFEAEKREYHPHVTLARRIAPPNLKLPPLRIDWPVDSFVLVESRTGGHQSQYEIIGRWPLIAPAGD